MNIDHTVLNSHTRMFFWRLPRFVKLL
uniref:Uncharacterized protein n=1 Tax=Anguilla anguilla TaxID=7936 RepID=A0A0E9UQ08_ANGAN